MKNYIPYGLGGSIVVLVFLFLFAVHQSENVNAQQPGNLTNLIRNNFSNILVEVVYESPNTLILKGHLIQPAAYGGTQGFNTDLWAATDLLKNQNGFKLQQVMTSGIGSEENPTVIYILMTK